MATGRAIQEPVRIQLSGDKDASTAERAAVSVGLAFQLHSNRLRMPSSCIRL